MIQRTSRQHKKKNLAAISSDQIIRPHMKAASATSEENLCHKIFTSTLAPPSSSTSYIFHHTHFVTLFFPPPQKNSTHILTFFLPISRLFDEDESLSWDFAVEVCAHHFDDDVKTWKWRQERIDEISSWFGVSDSSLMLPSTSKFNHDKVSFFLVPMLLVFCFVFNRKLSSQFRVSHIEGESFQWKIHGVCCVESRKRTNFCSATQTEL